MKLLLAAERLFALHGPDGASARSIVAEAGQKNASALNYYFQTREALIEAICELRMTPINNDRIERIATYLADRPEPASRVRTLAGILYRPGLILIVEAKGKSYFRRFLAQAINNPSTRFVPIVRDRFDSGLRQAAPLIREEIPSPSAGDRQQAHRDDAARHELSVGASGGALRRGTMVVAQDRAGGRDRAADRRLCRLPDRTA
ncbi:MAG: helix-turn-helix domain-containing protein [Xanthobacteraceae bacterium]